MLSLLWLDTDVTCCMKLSLFLAVKHKEIYICFICLFNFMELTFT